MGFWSGSVSLNLFVYCPEKSDLYFLYKSIDRSPEICRWDAQAYRLFAGTNRSNSITLSAAEIVPKMGRQGAFRPGVGENDQGKAFIRPSDM